MNRVLRSKRAAADLNELWAYVAVDDPAAADRLLLRIDEKARFLADHPLAGTARPELASELRSFVVGNYVIFYRPIHDGVRIVRVLNGARDSRRAFSG